MLSDLASFLRYTTALPNFLRRQMGANQAKRRLRESLAQRESRFLRIMERGVYAHAQSPYLQLLRWAGVGLSDLRFLVEKQGVEGALAALYDAGVWVTLDEVKGRCDIVRPGLHLKASLTAFDNPLLAHHYEGHSSGSRGPRSRAKIDLALLEHEAAYVHQYLDAFALWHRPYAVWRAVPPAAAAVKWLLRLEKLGKPLDRWFSHTRPELRNGQWKFALFTLTTIGGGRLLGRRFPSPQHVPGDAPAEVTRWLSQAKRAGTPAVLDTIVSSAVRVCLDARARGLDISGTLFRLGGEPLTAAKARIIAETGCHSLCFYSITETSFVGAPCATPLAFDDVHLLSDKIAALTRPRSIGAASVDALFYTTLLPSSPKLMLNVESGDFATTTTRECGCVLGQLGFTRHLHDIRSYEKLTSEGVSFLGTELLRLLEEVLPKRFGGAPTDYQFVEAEEGELSRIYVVVSARIGALDEQAVIECILATLTEYPGGSMMTKLWRQGETLRLLRREPYRTESGKILPLYLQRLGVTERRLSAE